MANVSSSNSQEVLVPKLRFPGFEGEWERHKLSDIAERVTRKNSNNESDLPLTISSKDGLVDQISFFNKTVASKDMSGYYLLKNGEFAYNKSYSVGYDFGSIKRLDRYPMGALSTLYICFALKENDSDFMKIYFDSLKWYKEIYMIAAEGARNHGLLNVPTEDFFSTKHIIPTDLTEQRKIANFLTLIEARVEKQRQLIEALKSYKRGLIRTLLSPDKNGQDDVKWTSISIGDLGTFVKGAPLSKADISKRGNPFILYGELYTTYGEVITSIARKTEAKVDSIYYSKIGDVIIPTSGETPEEISTAACVMVPDVILAGDLNIFRTTKVDGRILSYILNHIVNWEIARIAQGKSVVHIQASELAQIEITIPDRKEQSRIVSVIDGTDKTISYYEAILKLLVAVKNALLQQLFV